MHVFSSSRFFYDDDETKKKLSFSMRKKRNRFFPRKLKGLSLNLGIFFFGGESKLTKLNVMRSEFGK